jgi:hypothetical protein
VKLRLVPGQPASSKARLVPMADLLGRLARGPVEVERQRGALFVVSNPDGETRFIAVPDGERVGQLKIKRGRTKGLPFVDLSDGEVLNGFGDAERGWKFRG